MCKKRGEINFYYVNICRHEHENNVTKLWCKIVIKTNVEQTKGNERSYFYLCLFGELIYGSFQRGFDVCIE